ncbi:MAG: hypothetical protein PHI48_03525 [Bacteroidales bacterium]|nr:hypothetical protein [Bacteroidales bacterium]
MKTTTMISAFRSQLQMGLLIPVFAFGLCHQAISQEPASTKVKPFAPALLPGNGLSHFDFFYAGEAKQENMYIVRDGKIVWSYTHDGKGEISDAMMLSNGNILFAHQYGIAEVSQDKKVLWKYDAPEGTEIHTAQAIGKKLVLFVQSSNPAKIVVINKESGKIIKELPIPTGNPTGTHGQLRHARLTSKGTLLVAHMDMGKVKEYDSKGNQLRTIEAPGVWGVESYKNGNILITTRNKVFEVNSKSEVVWEYPFEATADYVINSPQVSIRLANGNTLIGNWFNQWGDKLDKNNLPLQAIEVTPDKKVVWALRAWDEPANLGPSTIIVPLSEPRTTEKVKFGEIH